MSTKEKNLDIIIKESDDIILMLSESIAARKAKKMGLVHKGFGNYGPEEGSSTFKTVKGKLIPIKGQTKDVGETKKRGVTDIMKVSGQDNLFTYRYNGNKRKITLDNEEMKSYVTKSLSLKQIIKARLDKIEKEKQGKIHKASKEQ